MRNSLQFIPYIITELETCFDHRIEHPANYTRIKASIILCRVKVARSRFRIPIVSCVYVVDGGKFAGFDFAVTVELDYSATRYEIGRPRRWCERGRVGSEKRRCELHNSVYDIRSHC